MDETFDPYLKWLGIRSSERPPNHYALLGLSLYEDDPEVISNAADRQMSHVRTFQVGPHSQWSQRLLNELAAAKLCLLRSDRKAAYDAALGERIAATAVAHPVAEFAEQPHAVEAPPVDTAASYASPPASPWSAPVDAPPLASPPPGSLDFSSRITLLDHDELAQQVAAVQPSEAATDRAGFTATQPMPMSHQNGFAATDDAQLNDEHWAAGLPSPVDHRVAEQRVAADATSPPVVEAFNAVRPTTAAARTRLRRRQSAPIGIYVILAGLLLLVAILSKYISDQRRAYEQEAAAQRAQETARRAAAAAPPESKWRRPPNRPRSVDVRRPRHVEEESPPDDRVPLRAREAGAPTSFDDPLLEEAQRDKPKP
ncbi:MAG: hypothetical protein K2Y37_27410 [Pirellulales bacterium]|nr:hypothetical protein [Pirellulales bacterium]